MRTLMYQRENQQGFSLPSTRPPGLRLQQRSHWCQPIKAPPTVALCQTLSWLKFSGPHPLQSLRNLRNPGVLHLCLKVSWVRLKKKRYVLIFYIYIYMYFKQLMLLIVIWKCLLCLLLQFLSLVYMTSLDFPKFRMFDLNFLDNFF